MKRGSSRMLLVAGGAIVLWSIGITVATRGAGVSGSASVSSSKTSHPDELWKPALIQGCGAEAQAYATTAIQAAAASGSQMSDHTFKNIQVLKGIPVDEFMGTMGLFSAAMGECCLDCHVPEWPADTPKKRTARRMVEMMTAINQANFGGRKVVSCWTCHRGANKPPMTPSLDLVYGGPILLAQADTVIVPFAEGMPPAEQIFDKYLKALGSVEHVAKMKSLVGKGAMTTYGATGSSRVEIYAQAPNQRMISAHTPAGDFTRTYDGRAGWHASSVLPVPVMELNGGELEGAKLEGQLFFPAQIKEVLKNWRVSFPATIDDRDVQVVQGSGAGDFLATLYFDQETGLLTRMVRYADSAVGRVPTQIDFADYREVSGIKVPFKWTLAWVTGRDVFQLSDVQLNVPVDPSRFAKPAASQGQ